MEKEMLHYEVHHKNNEETLLFIHGLGSSSWAWWQQLEAFNHYQIILVDLPGHGNSAHIPWINLRETIKQVADVIPEDKKVHVIGISLGGHVALELAKHYSEKLISVFISGITIVPMGPKIFSFLLPLYARNFEKNQRSTDKLYNLGKSYGLSKNRIPRFIEDYRAVSRETVENIFKELYSFNMDQTYAQIKAPIIFVACENEEKGIQYTLKKTPEIIKQADTALIPGAEHQWPLQKPNKFNRFLNNWLNTIEINNKTK